MPGVLARGTRPPRRDCQLQDEELVEGEPPARLLERGGRVGVVGLRDGARQRPQAEFLGEALGERVVHRQLTVDVDGVQRVAHDAAERLLVEVLGGGIDGQQAARIDQLARFRVVHRLPLGVVHLPPTVEHADLAAHGEPHVLRPGGRAARGSPEISGHPRLLEPDETQVARLVADDRHGRPRAPVRAQLDLVRLPESADHRLLLALDDLRDAPQRAVVDVARREQEHEVADGLYPHAAQLRCGGTGHALERLDRRVESDGRRRTLRARLRRRPDGRSRRLARRRRQRRIEDTARFVGPPLALLGRQLRVADREQSLPLERRDRGGARRPRAKRCEEAVEAAEDRPVGVAAGGLALQDVAERPKEVVDAALIRRLVRHGA